MKFNVLLFSLLICAQALCAQTLRIDNEGKIYRADGTYTKFTISPDGDAIFEGEIRGSGAFLNNLLQYEPRNHDIRAMSKVLTTTLTGLIGLSGATYNARSGTIFVIKNEVGAGATYEVSRDGTTIVRTITHSNFEDTEAIEWLLYDPATGADVFVIAEENPSQRLTLCRLTPVATTLDRTASGHASIFTGYSGGNVDNFGVESVCYDSKRGLIYFTAEKRTGITRNITGSQNAGIYQRSVTPTGTLAFGSESLLAAIVALYDGTLTDISDAAYDLHQDNFLLLSDESKKIVRVSRTGVLLETFPLAGFTQPEGLTLHPRAEQLWVTGEINEFSRYQIGSDP